ncbi:alpha/beta fold hydrolase [Paenarthrobacter sp. NPDC092416]|uniref:alpha/beta fold hydrolase n=1 Tax=Paenarthrobacter sp. NPDC092416 TaxID=3364386 RepID=UPI003825F3B7
METTTSSERGPGPARSSGLEHPKASHSVVCLHGSADADSWFSDQLLDFGAWAWDGSNHLGGQPASAAESREWAASAASALVEAETGPVHVIATGSSALGAIALGASRPELVKSLILGDPEVDPADVAYASLLRDVRAPTLVIAAAPAFDTDISKPQSVAGGIKNGVFVIIDNCHVPAHRNRPASFNEWAKSFINIAEGLHAFTRPEEDGNV